VAAKAGGVAFSQLTSRSLAYGWQTRNVMKAKMTNEMAKSTMSAIVNGIVKRRLAGGRKWLAGAMAVMARREIEEKMQTSSESGEG